MLKQCCCHSRESVSSKQQISIEGGFRVIMASMFHPTPEPLTEEERKVPRVDFRGHSVLKKKNNSAMMVHERHKIRKAKAAAEELAEKDKNKVKTKTKFTKLVKWLKTVAWYIVVSFVLVAGLSRMITESWFWGYDGKYVHYHWWFPPSDTFYTPEMLSRYDGTNDQLPLLLGIDGLVYDVSDNKGMYGKGSSYHHFVGRDASRAFVTGCFKTGLTHDLRGLDESEHKRLKHWKDFFENSNKYTRVGKIVRPPIDPSSPLPPPCDSEGEGGSR